MSYLEKLIERATDIDLDLDNNRIGNYEITPQHGSNVSIFHIFKIGAKYLPTGRRYGSTHRQHVCTITIDVLTVGIEVDADYLTTKEISDITLVINNIYDDKGIWV